MSPLQRLILARMHERGWDAKTVEQRGVSHATLHRYMNPVRLQTPPRPATVRQLSSALDLQYDTVWRAAVETVDWSQQHGSNEPAADDPELLHRAGLDPAAEIPTDVLREMVKQQEETNRALRELRDRLERLEHPHPPGGEQ